jgi:molecular chaperone GrpE
LGPLPERRDFRGDEVDRDADFSELNKGSDNGVTDDQLSDHGTGGSGGAETVAGQDEVQKLRAELLESNDKYLRALADFENYKKRALKERSELLKYQGERILVDLLEVLDNLELAVKHSAADPAKLRQGVELIQKLFIDALGKWEVRSVAGVGLDFDPTRFEAVSRVKSDDAKPGTIVSELRRAYMYKDKLLRVGQVVLAEAPAGAEGDNGPSHETETSKEGSS